MAVTTSEQPVPAKRLLLRKVNFPKPRHQASALASNRLLVSVNVLGSAGAIRFVVREDEPAAAVIATALRSYAKEGRLPVLGSDLDGFLLYRANAGSDALEPTEPIGRYGIRNFVLCKKDKKKMGAAGEEEEESATPTTQGSGKTACFGGWKSWLNHSSSYHKVPSH